MRWGRGGSVLGGFLMRVSLFVFIRFLYHLYFCSVSFLASFLSLSFFSLLCRLIRPLLPLSSSSYASSFLPFFSIYYSSSSFLPLSFSPFDHTVKFSFITFFLYLLTHLPCYGDRYASLSMAKLRKLHRSVIGATLKPCSLFCFFIHN